MTQHEIIESPSGWEIVKFTDILDVQGGTQPPKKEFLSEPKEGYIRLLQIRDFGNKPVPTFVPFTTKLRTCTEDDVLIGRYGASIGRICTGMKGAYNVALAKVVKPDLIDSNYLKYFLISQRFQAPLNLLSRSAQNGFNKQDLSKFDFFVPPLLEQKRIVEKLNSLLAQVETIQQRLNNLPDIIKRFRQSVLFAAVSGKLTEQWRVKNDCGEWNTVRIGDVITPISQGWSPKCNNVPASKGKWGVIKTSAVQSIHFLEQENKELPEHLEPRQKLQVKKGDILVTRAGPRIRCGITCLVSEINSKLMICDKVYRFNVSEGKGESKFLVLQLNSLKYLEDIEKLKTGISDSGMNLTQKKFKELLLEWPSKIEQIEIVRLVEQYFALADTLEKHLADAKARVDNLTQSILAKAFRGELVPQDPNDEPADKLLERIKAARLEAEKLEKAAKKAAKVKR